MKYKEILFGFIGLLLGVLISLVFTGSHTNYKMLRSSNDMMGSSNAVAASQQVALIKQEEEQGLEFLQEIQSKMKSCKDLSQDNFEKIGDYIMKQRIGTSEKHAVMDVNMEQMMGKDQNVRMHIALGENAAGCAIPSDTSTNSGTIQMMNNSISN